jgi:hypothetical protein
MSLWGGYSVPFESRQQGWGSKNFKVTNNILFDDTLCIHYKKIPAEIEYWLIENGINYFIEPCYECVKHVFFETEDNRNEYMFVDYKIHFENTNDMMFFKLRWG